MDFITKINVDGQEYKVKNLMDDNLGKSVYVIVKSIDVIDTINENIVSIKETEEGVIDFIRNNPLDDEDEEWYEIFRYNLS